MEIDRQIKQIKYKTGVLSRLLTVYYENKKLIIVAISAVVQLAITLA
jgi:hypothetical protein